MADKTTEQRLLEMFELVQQLSRTVLAQEAHVLAIESYLRAQPSYDGDAFLAALKRHMDDPGAAIARDKELIDAMLRAIAQGFKGPPQ